MWHGHRKLLVATTPFHHQGPGRENNLRDLKYTGHFSAPPGGGGGDSLRITGVLDPSVRHPKGLDITLAEIIKMPMLAQNYISSGKLKLI